MIDLAAARTAIEDLCRSVLPAETLIYPSGLMPLAQFPAVVIGQPSWTPSAQLDLSYGLDRYRWPVAVVLEKPGVQDPTSVDVLDQLWTTLLVALDQQAQGRPGWGGVCKGTLLDHAEFGVFTVQGQAYPAQTIYVDLYG